MATNDRIPEKLLVSRDLDWFACDLEGHVGYFTTSGMGAMPESVVQSNSRRKLLFSQFRSCPVSTKAVRVVDVSAKNLADGVDAFFVSFEEMSVKGLYSYQAKHSFVPPIVYELITKPQTPLVIDALPPDMQSVITLTRLQISFKKCSFIHPSDIV